MQAQGGRKAGVEAAVEADWAGHHPSQLSFTAAAAAPSEESTADEPPPLLLFAGSPR